MAEIIRENEGAIELKTLGKPKRSTVVDASSRVVDDDDVSSLNAGLDGGGKERPPSSREIAAQSQAKRTVLGNHGPNKDGTVDWDRNPDCVDYILQKHESSGSGDTPEGYLATAQKCTNQFNKLFKSRVTADQIAEALSKFNTPGRPRAEAPKQAAASAVSAKPAEPIENFYPLSADELPVDARSNVVQLNGTKFEICKILGCKNISIAPVTRGVASESGTFHAVCQATNADGQIEATCCPQETPLTPKEQFAYEMYLNQFNGDQLKAKKFLYMSRALYADEKKKRK